MKFFQRPVFTGFMPNLLTKEVAKAFFFCLPWNFKSLQQGKYIDLFEKKLSDYYKNTNIILCDSGRSGLKIALEALGIQKGDEVLVQAYTCAVVSNAVIWSGAKPVYVDVLDNFTMNPKDVEKKITASSKVLIIQHSFGIPADLDALIEIARKYNLKIIEDCAHVMGAFYNGKLLGTFGDISMLSFGSEKAISCGRGGALLTHNQKYFETLKKIQSQFPQTAKVKIFQQLFTFILFFIFKPLYNIGIGKIFLAFFKKLGISSRIIDKNEKIGQQVSSYPSQFPNAFACIALHQMKHLDEFNTKRKNTSNNYFENIKNPHLKMCLGYKDLPLLRFPILLENPQKLLNMAEKEGILLGNWYNTPIAPNDCDSTKMGYLYGTCPNAEKLAGQSVNLPTSPNISEFDQKKIIQIVNSYSE